MNIFKDKCAYIGYNKLKSVIKRCIFEINLFKHKLMIFCTNCNNNIFESKKMESYQYKYDFICII